MAGMRLGLNFTQQKNLRDVAKWYEACDKAGLAVVGTPDSPALLRELYVSTTVAALATERIAIMTMVTNPVTRHPSVTAAAAMSLDELAERSVVGVPHVVADPARDLRAEHGLARPVVAIAVVLRFRQSGDRTGRVGDVVRVERRVAVEIDDQVDEDHRSRAHLRHGGRDLGGDVVDDAGERCRRDARQREIHLDIARRGRDPEAVPRPRDGRRG